MRKITIVADDPAECPKCGFIVPVPYKTWKTHSPLTKVTMIYKLYTCPRCKKSFRIVRKGE